MSQAIMRPSAIGPTYDAWLLGAGASKYAATDPGASVSHDDDTTYITKGVTPGGTPYQDLYMNTGMPTPGEIVSVTSVDVHSYVKRYTGSADTYGHILVLGGTAGSNMTSSVGTSYTDHASTGYSRPGGGSWVAGDFTNNNFVFRTWMNTDSAAGFRLTSAWFVITYVPSPGGFVAMVAQLAPFVFGTLGVNLSLRDITRIAQLPTISRVRRYTESEMKLFLSSLRNHPHRRYCFLKEAA